MRSFAIFSDSNSFNPPYIGARHGMIKFVVDVKAAQEEEQERPNDIISFIGYAPIYRFDERRQVYKEVDFYQLDVKVVPKNKEFRQLILDHPQQSPYVLGEDNQVVKLSRDHKYFGDSYLFLPIRLLRRRGYDVTESEIERLAFDTKDLGPAGYMWEDQIDGIAPVRELGEKAGIVLALHNVVEDKDLMARSAVNNDPSNTVDLEQFYKAVRCTYWDCPIHRPFETFLEAWWKEKKMSPRSVLVGSQVNSRDAQLVDFLLFTKPILEVLHIGAELLF